MLRHLNAGFDAVVTEVLTLLLRTLPRWVRDWRSLRGCDYKLVERLRRREYDWRHQDYE
jgi:hypothetical protein